MNILIFLKNLIQLLLSPGHAWSDIEEEQQPVQKIIQRGLYPLMAVMLVTVFIRPLYSPDNFQLIPLLQKALVQFVALFIALYGARNIMEHFLTRYNCTGEKDPVAVGTVATYGTGLMTLFQIAENVIPVELTLTQLLPAFAAVCVWKADKYLDVEPSSEMKYMLICVASLIVPVVGINFIMSFIIS